MHTKQQLESNERVAKVAIANFIDCYNLARSAAGKAIQQILELECTPKPSSRTGWTGSLVLLLAQFLLPFLLMFLSTVGLADTTHASPAGHAKQAATRHHSSWLLSARPGATQNNHLCVRPT